MTKQADAPHALAQIQPDTARYNQIQPDTPRFAHVSRGPPLTRVVFSVGDSVTSHEGWQLTITALDEDDGVVTYIGTRSDTGEAATLDEGDLDNFLRFRTPRDRLFAGLIDGHRWFMLRRDVFAHRDRIARSPIRGLEGARVSVLPHQIHVAVEALTRPAPRDSAPDGNPFLAEQLVLLSTDTLIDDAAGQDIGDAAVAAGFDMMVVDEAHHLAGDTYDVVAALAAVVPSVLLLTATPEQLGRSGHFARLRLLDPARFDDEERFAKEEEGFQHIARIAGQLDDAHALDASEITELERVLDKQFDDTQKSMLSSDAAMAASELPARLVADLVIAHSFMKA